MRLLHRSPAAVLLAAVVLLATSATAQAALTAPTISGGPLVVGGVLTASAGGGIPDGVTPSYQWQRCNSTGGGCIDVGASTAAPTSYTIVAADAGNTLRVRLSADMLDPVQSDPTGVVPRAPANTAAPTVSGIPRDGLVLSGTRGTWTGTPPPTFDLQWERCDPSGLPICTGIPQATSSTYALLPADVGNTIRLLVTASNAGGTASALSAPTGVVTPSPLVNLAPPAISGIAAVGQSLTSTPGAWGGDGPIAFLFRWLRCGADGSSCDAIPSATVAKYDVQLADVGSRLGVRVTAFSDAGSSTRDSALTGVVPTPPGAQVFAQSGTSPSSNVVAKKSTKRPSLIKPFPRVHIKGFFTASGAVMQVLTVSAPKGSKITLSCRGRDCPYRSHARRAIARVRLRSLERPFHAGTKIQIRITRPSRIGKYTSLLVRARRSPARHDRCLMPGSKKPVKCPSK
jgi:hypothetical protein